MSFVLPEWASTELCALKTDRWCQGCVVLSLIAEVRLGGEKYWYVSFIGELVALTDVSEPLGF